MAELILVTGATGYIGGRLVPRLLEEGYRVRCLVRDASRLPGHTWLKQVEIVEGDALTPASLEDALRGVAVAYYLIHGMTGMKVDVERDLQAARHFTQAAERANLRCIIYLGELVEKNAEPSPYQRSRLETGAILRQGKVPVMEFRSGMVVGSGSVLFEMVRYIAERQPIFVCPRWWFTKTQPIAIRDVLAYLLAALRVRNCSSDPIEIGGATRLSYAEMLQDYAEERKFRRILIPVPFSLPLLSSYWVHMVTPIHWRVILPLIEGLTSNTLVDDPACRELFPQIKPMDFRSALQLALGRVQSDTVETSWSDSLVVSQGDTRPVTLRVTEGMMIDQRQVMLDADPGRVFQVYTGLGGKRGWLYMNWTWEIRGWMDKLVGGVGLRRGRRDADELRAGDALDFWRVEAIEPGCLLRLRAEMKVPGKAWLQFESLPREGGGTRLVQSAYFAPRGLAGFLYWYSLYPIHGFIFRGMIRAIARLAAISPESPSEK